MPSEHTSSASHPFARWLRFPSSLLSGVRGILLAAVLLAATAGMLPMLVFASNHAPAVRLAAVVGLVALGGWYLWGYRRRRLPTLGVVFEGPVLAVVAVVSGGPETALPILFPGLFFRVFHSSLWGYLGAVAVFVGAYVAAGVGWPALHGEPPAGGGFVGNLLALPLMGSVMYGFSLALVRLQERTREAERLIRDLQIEIGERHRAEAALSRSEQRYRQILETTQEGMWMGDTAHRTTFANAQLANLLGCAPEQIMGRTLDSFLSPDDLASLVAPLSGGSAVRCDVQIRRPDGSLRWAIVSTSPVASDDGELLGTVAMMTDITERKLAEEALRTRDRAIAATSTGVAISAVHDDVFPVVYVNPAFERLTGYTSAEMLDSSLAVLNGPDTDPADVEAIYAAVTEQREAAVTTLARRKDGTHIWIDLTIAPVRGDDGRVTHFVWLLADATARKDAERQVERIARTEKLRALGQMATGIAHDLNQSLMLIASYSDLSRQALDAETLDVDDLREMFDIVTRAALDGGETVKRLLLFTRAPAEGTVQPVDLTALVREVAQLTAPRWRDASQAEGRPISLSINSSAQPVITGSPARLREVLTNMIFNAVDALPTGGAIHLRVADEGGQAIVDIIDNGVGMPLDVQARMFEPFFSTKGDSGSGLGLAMAFGVVERHQGQIAVDSVVGRGTRIRLSFPRLEVPRVVGASEAPISPSLRPLRILAVDDEPAIGQSVRRALRSEGHTVVVATSGEDAVEQLAGEPFDLLVSDVGMGAGMNGWELAGLARRGWPDLPIVLATGWGAAIDADDARAKGIDAVLAKPYLPEDLRRVVNACVRR